MFPKVTQELNTSSCEFQIHAAKAVQEVVKKTRLPPTNLLTAVLQGVESKDPLVVSAWLETLLVIIPTLKEDKLRSEVGQNIYVYIHCNNFVKLFID